MFGSASSCARADGECDRVAVSAGGQTATQGRLRRPVDCQDGVAADGDALSRTQAARLGQNAVAAVTQIGGQAAPALNLTGVGIDLDPQAVGLFERVSGVVIRCGLIDQAAGARPRRNGEGRVAIDAQRQVLAVGVFQIGRLIF